MGLNIVKGGQKAPRPQVVVYLLASRTRAFISSTHSWRPHCTTSSSSNHKSETWGLFSGSLTFLRLPPGLIWTLTIDMTTAQALLTSSAPLGDSLKANGRSWSGSRTLWNTIMYSVEQSQNQAFNQGNALFTLTLFIQCHTQTSNKQILFRTHTQN